MAGFMKNDVSRPFGYTDYAEHTDESTAKSPILNAKAQSRQVFCFLCISVLFARENSLFGEKPNFLCALATLR
jgi:hypothetical protein